MNQNSRELLMFIFDGAPHQRGAESQCAYSDTLDAYIDTELDQGMASANARFPELQAHLSECHACQEAYDDLKAVVQARREAPFVQPAVEPQFDFSYLRPSIWEVVQTAKRKLSGSLGEILIVSKKGIAFFDQLPSPLVAKWELAPMGSRAEDEDERVHVLSLPSGESDLLFRYLVSPPVSKERAAELSIEVLKSSSDGSEEQEPVPLVRVTLRRAKGRMVESNITRQDGRVVFADVQDGRYVVEIKLKKQRWQIPITVLLQE